MRLAFPHLKRGWLTAILLAIVVLSSMSLSGASVVAARWRAHHAPSHAADAPSRLIRSMPTHAADPGHQ
jgi:hypothetical protein